MKPFVVFFKATLQVATVIMDLVSVFTPCLGTHQNFFLTKVFTAATDLTEQETKSTCGLRMRRSVIMRGFLCFDRF
jgi:hypothetical protein